MLSLPSLMRLLLLCLLLLLVLCFQSWVFSWYVQKKVLHRNNCCAALGRGVNVSSFFIAIFALLILWVLDIPNFVGVWGAMIAGLVAGIGIGKTTEYYTSSAYKPTQKLLHATKTGPATVIISGIGTGMISTAIPVLIVPLQLFWHSCLLPISILRISAWALWYWYCCSRYVVHTRYHSGN